MKTIFISIRGNLLGGGPSVFVHKFAHAIQKRGWQVVYDNPQNSDVALCIINTGKILKKVGPQTKVFLRLDGIYNCEYNEKFNRAITPEMSAMHMELKRDIPFVHTIFQSAWSKDRIFEEITTTDRYSIIHNGCDTNYFHPTPRESDDHTNLITVGKMRNGYFMESLMATYNELKRKNKKVRLLLAGSMDEECKNVYNKYKDDGIVLLGSFPNDQLQKIYTQGDIFLAPRQGSSSDNVISEAQACGLPVICASWSGNAEMVADGKSGKIVKSGHWDYDENYHKNLTNGVEEIINDLENYKFRARQHAVEQLSIERMIDSYLEAFEKC